MVIFGCILVVFPYQWWLATALNFFRGFNLVGLVFVLCDRNVKVKIVINQTSPFWQWQWQLHPGLWSLIIDLWSWSLFFDPWSWSLMICPGSPFPRHLPPPSPSNSRRSRLSSSSKTSRRTNDSNSSGRSTITYRTHTTSTHGIFGKKTKEQFECSFERWDLCLNFYRCLYLYLYL